MFKSLYYVFKGHQTGWHQSLRLLFLKIIDFFQLLFISDKLGMRNGLTSWVLQDFTEAELSELICSLCATVMLFFWYLGPIHTFFLHQQLKQCRPMQARLSTLGCSSQPSTQPTHRQDSPTACLPTVGHISNHLLAGSFPH